MKQSLFTLEHARQLTADTYELVLSGDTSAVTAPGQFVNIQLPGKFLRRPISICNWTEDALLLLVRVVGEGTHDLVRCVPGTELDVLSGLGNGFDLTLGGAHPILLGGGIGIAPLYGLAQRMLEAGIAQSPEGRRVFPNLTVLENLKIGAYLRKDKDGIEKDIRWVYDLFPRLQERHWQQAGTLSGGEQQMLAVGRALMSRPKLLMLDEPSLGLAPLVVQGIFDIIRTVNQQGMTVLLIEQNANMALKIADYAYVLETGCITKSGTGAELLADESIKEAYLGKKKK